MSRVLELSHDLPVKKVMAGEALMTQGGTELVMAVLKSGKVSVITDGQPIAMVENEGAIFGEMAVILNSVHTATVIAIETSEFFMINNPTAFLWERAEFNFELLHILAKRLEDMDRRLAEYKYRSQTAPP